MARNFTIQVSDFCRVLYRGANVSDLNAGTYDGTDIPLRAVPTDAEVTIEDKGVIIVTDADGGWIADRLCSGTIGRRQLHALHAWRSTTKEIL